MEALFRWREKVDRTGHRANTNEVTDFIEVFVNPKNINLATIAELYRKGGLSAAKIATQVGLSKSAVLSKLHSLGIRRENLKDIEYDNHRPAIRAPFGQKIVTGKLVPNRHELKIARLIVELRARQSLSWKEIVHHLESENLKTRNGFHWKIRTAKRVFDRWNGKL